MKMKKTPNREGRKGSRASRPLAPAGTVRPHVHPPETNSPKTARPVREPLVRAAVLELCATVHLDGRLADRALEHLLKREKNLFSSERRAVGETLFQILRRERFLDFALGIDPAQAPSSKALFTARYAAARVLFAGVPVAQVVEEGALDGSLADRLSRMPLEIPGDADAMTKVALAGSLPDCLARTLVDDLGEADALGFAKSLMARAPLTIRANTLKTDRESLKRLLRRRGVEASFTGRAPDGLTAMGFPRLTDLPEFEDGLFEVQDEGSQLLAHLLGARPGELVADTCAGAGGKTLALAAAMQGKGTLWALDVGAGRLRNLTKRLQRAVPGFPVRTQPIPEVFDAARDTPKLLGRCDRVLIDAPCSGLGVLRRSPDAKYRFDESTIPSFARLQKDILERHSALVRPGGRLVYATCSMARAENEDVVQGFLTTHPGFRLLDARTCLPDSAAPMVRNGFFRPFPHVDGCDGFFGAVMERNPEPA